MRCMSGLALLWCVREEGFEVNYQCPSCGYRSTSRWYECAQKKCLLYRPVKKRQKATHAENIPTFFPVVDFQTWQVIFPLGAGGLSLPRVHHCVAYFTTRRLNNHRNCSLHTVEVRHNFILEGRPCIYLSSATTNSSTNYYNILQYGASEVQN